jgi:hypothetical protein
VTCTIDVCKPFCFSGVVKADLRISIKDYHRNRSVKILLFGGNEWGALAEAWRACVPEPADGGGAEVAGEGAGEQSFIGQA